MPVAVFVTGTVAVPRDGARNICTYLALLAAEFGFAAHGPML
jgi:hypothetical protein